MKSKSELLKPGTDRRAELTRFLTRYSKYDVDIFFKKLTSRKLASFIMYVRSVSNGLEQVAFFPKIFKSWA